MITPSVPLPKHINIACDGGLASMAIVSFLQKKHKVTVAHFYTTDDAGHARAKFVARYCADNWIPMIIGRCRSEKDKKESQEEYWRRERYDFLRGLGPIITCHHCDDTGISVTTALIHHNMLRPFLMTRDQEFISWCNHNNVSWIEGESK